MRSIRPYLIAVAIVVLTAAFLAPPMGLARENGASAAAINEIAYAALPPEAQQTLQLIRKGGPYPYQRGGVAFGNYERLLPQRNRGYYREYTVATPGAKNRAARRIIAGQIGEYYYTDDHYRSFRRIRE
jgi:ribonuclease T1